MKEDILEQLVDDYLQFRGYFTTANVKFKPRPDHPDFVKKEDSVASDIDVVAINPRLRGPQRVWAVSCKSWQAGFNVRSKLSEIREGKRRSGRDVRKGFRELVFPKWSEAFCDRVHELTGSRSFTYVTAVTSVRGDRSDWTSHPPFVSALGGNPIALITLTDMLEEMIPELGTTVAGSSLGRTLQLLKAADVIGG